MEVVGPLIEFGEQQHRRENKNCSSAKTRAYPQPVYKWSLLSIPEQKCYPKVNYIIYVKPISYVSQQSPLSNSGI